MRTEHTEVSGPSADSWKTFLEQVSSIAHESEASSRPILGRGRSSPIEEKTPTKAEFSYLNKLLNSKLVETHELDVEILRADPEHPLHSAKTFQEMGLNESLLRGVASMGYYKPSMIQEKALPSLIGSNPQNMIAQSQSGTGKTATFLLAMLSRLNAERQYAQCLCMAPTRELALQIASVGRQMAKYMNGVTFGTAVRGDQAAVDADGFVLNQVIVGTPGTVAQWVRCTGPVRLDASRLITFVLDEADLMMEEEGFLNITMRIKNKLSPACQILLFSATYDEQVMEFARDYVPNPIEIRVKRTQLPLKNIKQYYLLFNDWVEKYQALTDIYGGFSVGQAIIFCDTRKEASWLEGRMTLDGHRVVILSGDLDVSEREKVIGDFRNADCRVLITTNICSRGLDIPQVNLIINWNMPVTRDGSADWETYLHRIGRSGRFGKEGVAVNFVTHDEQYLLQELEQQFQIQIPLLTSDDLAGA